MLENCYPEIKISMLGRFKLEIEGVIIDESYNRAHKLWNLLQYLIIYRNRDISNDELIEFLWGDEENTNPLAALKNLIYRLRTLLANANIPYAKELIVHKQGIYSWNKNFKTIVDIDFFEELLIKANNLDSSDKERIAYYTEALSIYIGDFLTNLSYQTWMIPLSSFYRNLYICGVKNLTALLERKKDYEAILKICESALAIDKFNEELHLVNMKTFINLNNYQQAIDYYGYVSKLFYNELGVKLSDEFLECYKKVTKDFVNIETNLDIVKEDLSETKDCNGAFICEYEVFKNFYKLEARSAVRTGRALFVGMLTIAHFNGETLSQEDIVYTMEILFNAIEKSLRNSDVVSRFSPTQYILLLPTHTYENGIMVLKRIVQCFNAKNKQSHIIININIKPIEPIV